MYIFKCLILLFFCFFFIMWSAISWWELWKQGAGITTELELLRNETTIFSPYFKCTSYLIVLILRDLMTFLLLGRVAECAFDCFFMYANFLVKAFFLSQFMRVVQGRRQMSFVLRGCPKLNLVVALALALTLALAQALVLALTLALNVELWTLRNFGHLLWTSSGILGPVCSLFFCLLLCSSTYHLRQSSNG